MAGDDPWKANCKSLHRRGTTSCTQKQSSLPTHCTINPRQHVNSPKPGIARPTHSQAGRQTCLDIFLSMFQAGYIEISLVHLLSVSAQILATSLTANSASAQASAAEG